MIVHITRIISLLLNSPSTQMTTWPLFNPCNTANTIGYCRTIRTEAHPPDCRRDISDLTSTLPLPIGQTSSQTMIEFRVKATELGKLYRLTSWGESWKGSYNMCKGESDGQRSGVNSCCCSAFVFRIGHTTDSWASFSGGLSAESELNGINQSWPDNNENAWPYCHTYVSVSVSASRPSAHCCFLYTFCDIVYWYSFQKLIKQKCLQLSVPQNCGLTTLKCSLPSLSSPDIMDNG